MAAELGVQGFLLLQAERDSGDGRKLFAFTPECCSESQRNGAQNRGKPVRKKKRNSASTRVAAALRMAALSLRHSQAALGAYYRRIAQRRGGDIAGLRYCQEVGYSYLPVLRWGCLMWTKVQPHTKDAIARMRKRLCKVINGPIRIQRLPAR